MCAVHLKTLNTLTRDEKQVVLAPKYTEISIVSECCDPLFLKTPTMVDPQPDNRTGAALYTFKYVRVQDSYIQLA